jgi:hypothetical protein
LIGICTGKEEVGRFVALYPAFKNRSWEVIKAKINNQINKMKKRLELRINELK